MHIYTYTIHRSLTERDLRSKLEQELKEALDAERAANKLTLGKLRCYVYMLCSIHVWCACIHMLYAIQHTRMYLLPVMLYYIPTRIYMAFHSYYTCIHYALYAIETDRIAHIKEIQQKESEYKSLLLESQRRLEQKDNNNKQLETDMKNKFVTKIQSLKSERDELIKSQIQIQNETKLLFEQERERSNQIQLSLTNEYNMKYNDYVKECNLKFEKDLALGTINM